MKYPSNAPVTATPACTVEGKREKFAASGGALPFRIDREACPIFLGPKILSRLICLDLVFCLFKFILLGSHLAGNLYFG